MSRPGTDQKTPVAVLGATGLVGQHLVRLLDTHAWFELAEVVVHPSSDLAGKTLAGAEVRQRFGIIVVALKRGEESTFNPGPGERIEAGDVLVALGPIQALEEIEQATQ